MELRELRSFCVAARVRSISRAADILGIGQPTVTTHVQKLEAELGHGSREQARYSKKS